MQPLIKRVFKTNGIKAILVNIFTLSFGWGLSTGDIAFTAFNADGDDDFAIVALVDIPANTTIYFSDNEPNSDGTGFLDYNEGQLKWATGGSTISQGTIIVFTDTDNDGNASFGASAGTLSDPFGRDPNLAASGDALYAVEGTDNGSAITVSAWLAGIQNEAGNGGSNFDQTGLTAGTTFINFYSSGSPDGGYYSGDRQGKNSFEGYLNLLGNNSKWTTETSTGENILPISTSSFHEGVSISGSSNHFRMMSSPEAGTVYDDILEPLWIQGMTGGDVTIGTANVWTYDATNTEWDALTNLNTASQVAGEGFLVYVYTDVDNDGDDDLPVSVEAGGTENSGSVEVPSSGANLADDAWLLAGNPYASTIDWDLVEQTNVTTSAYVWDSQADTPAYISWNGSTGSLSNGLIAPYQGFWIQGDGGSGSITIAKADTFNTAGTFYKTMNDSTGSMSFAISSGEEYEDNAFVSFMTNGEAGMDNADAYKLLPMSPSERVVGISYAEGNGLDINNLPYNHDGSISIPLDVMYLTVDDDYNFVTNENDVSMTWDVSSLPGHVSLTLTDNATGASVSLTEESEITFSTEAKGSFLSYGTGGVNIYPQVGESRFTLTVAYSALTSNDEPANLPGSFILHPAYPNPFNPITTLCYDLPEQAHVTLTVYDLIGREITQLVNTTQEAGFRSVQWNATDSFGKPVSAGVYFYEIQAGRSLGSQKIVLVK